MFAMEYLHTATDQKIQANILEMPTGEGSDDFVHVWGMSKWMSV